MKNMQKSENKAFLLGGEHPVRSTQCVSEHPLFIDTRGKVDELVEKWKTHTLCLLHGERFHWKDRCSWCRYLIRFPARRVG